MALSKSRLKKYTDFYIPESAPDEGYAYPGPVVAISDKDLLTTVYKIAEACRKEQERLTLLKGSAYEVEDFSLSFEGFDYRCFALNSMNGKVYKLRKIPDEVYNYDKLGLPEYIKKYIDNEEFLANGLLLVCGGHGQGKSTTCSSIVKRRLENYGGVCIAIEDPPEFPLSGRHNDGICYQVPVSQGGFSSAIRGAMRSYPVGTHGIILIGEVRDAETAVEAIQASLNGRLVIATIHANSVIDALFRLESMANSLMGKKEVQLKLASGFRMAIHQKLILSKEKITTKILLSTQQTFAHLREGKYDTLLTEKQRQRSLMMKGEEVPLKYI